MIERVCLRNPFAGSNIKLWNGLSQMQTIFSHFTVNNVKTIIFVSRRKKEEKEVSVCEIRTPNSSAKACDNNHYATETLSKVLDNSKLYWHVFSKIIDNSVLNDCLVIFDIKCWGFLLCLWNDGKTDLPYRMPSTHVHFKLLNRWKYEEPPCLVGT